jgi:magnesium transporter
LTYDLENGLSVLKHTPNLENSALVTICSAEEFEQTTFPDLPSQTPHGNIRGCRLECHTGYLYGTLRLFQSDKTNHSHSAFFYLQDNHLILISNDPFWQQIIPQIAAKKRQKESILLFFHDLMAIMLDGELPHLESLEEQLEKLEEQTLEKLPDEFSRKMLPLKKEIAKRYRYYSQLLAFGTELAEQIPCSSQDVTAMHALVSRISFLRDETAMLREYAMQLREVFQAQTDIRQNNIMKVLTIVTTVFFPLSVIAGWYGMNFTNMPELQWKYGYLCIIIISLVIVLLCILLFKKKKFW